MIRKIVSIKTIIVTGCLCFVSINIMAQKKDTVVFAGSSKYLHASFIRKFLMGSNYRKEWSTPVAVPVFDLKKSGLIIQELGGGMQTKSLQLFDKDKREWALRSVDKNAKGALPENLRNPFFVAFVQDMISASHPYAALAVGHLAKSAGIAAPNPVLYFIPDDPAFGKYQKEFANTLCFLEQREPTIDKTEAEDTDEVLAGIVEDNNQLILQQEVLKARLLDMLVADWDRHADQWKWGVQKKDGSNFYYAIPRDRDQAFFMSKGFIPRIAKIVAMPHINSFTKRSRGLKNLNYKAWGFDKIFLNELDKEQWEATIKQFQNSLNDEVVAVAVKKMPKEILALSGEEIESKLIRRRNTLMENALDYYEFISGVVTVTGTKEREAFSVVNKEGKLVVQVHRLDQENKKGALIYERKFDKKETGRIYLNGLEGNDHFFADASVKSRIKIIINGGAGSDTYDMRGSLKVSIKDTKEEKNNFEKSNKAVVKLN